MARTLSGKVALVTGASSGIGRAVALSLANEGAKVVCCDLKAEPNPEGYEEDIDTHTSDLIIKRGGEAAFEKIDLGDITIVEQSFTRAISVRKLEGRNNILRFRNLLCKQVFGRLDILVNCAGYWAPFRDFVDEDDALWDKMANINLLGTAKISRLAIRQFLKQEVDTNWGSRGRIVNISSCAGHIAFPGEVAYSATKAGINHMTRAGAMDHAKDSININCVAPGTVQTGMARKNFENKDILGVMRKATPWPRLGKAEDIAAAVLFFCIPQSQWITGQLLPVDGGMTLGVPPPQSD